MPLYTPPPEEEHITELRRLGKLRDQAEVDLRDAVINALGQGASIRVVAAAANLSPTTVMKWKRDYY